MLIQSKVTLRILVTTTIIVGFGFSIFPFFASMNPTAKAYEALIRIEIPELVPNSYRYVANPFNHSTVPSEILVVRRAGDEYDLWFIPKQGNQHALPDYYWWTPGEVCEDLSPDFEAETIRCKDSRFQNSPHYVWTLDGAAVLDEPWIPDMTPIPALKENEKFVLYHPAAKHSE